MSLSKERLLEFKEDAVRERQKHLDMLQQANGAIAMLDFLISQSDQESAPSKEE